MNSPIKLPDIPWSLLEALPEEAITGVYIYAEQAVREALAEYVPVACCLATSQDFLHEFSPIRDAKKVAKLATQLRQKLVHLYVIPENNHADRQV